MRNCIIACQSALQKLLGDRVAAQYESFVCVSMDVVPGGL